MSLGKRIKNIPKGKYEVPCQVCGDPIKELWCTQNTCVYCCKEGACPRKNLCKAYVDILERKLEMNPSFRGVRRRNEKSKSRKH